ncbi:MAG: Sb-PDE family phosphodiesterase [Pseudomonadales bacterium]|jgi:hypothetical protein|nr:Sb-PDE family phosphodiesterase [Pseudomonadales bacterium]MDP6472191.1 Sb-PDE family phosphodiesterase [Pseudomonadales bacterium]MDP6826557.1 Sb-PDE family phosphodiesterase [Pseudomonadales bacterium]MDP6970365.1 Sb-PDE family phosphodiesterase [Pseudomonadales bacterium]
MQAKFATITGFVAFGSLIIAVAVSAHGPASQPRGSAGGRAIEFPDTASHQTLVVDLHTHSAFSDGHVWPGIRVGEAIADGLDAFAITEHLEWQPHLDDIPHPDRNRAYQVALEAVPETSDLIVIAGSEITRQAPFGHMNAVFIRDANALVRPGVPPVPFDAIENFRTAAAWPTESAVQAASEQNAFVFWNHSWSEFANRKTEITEFHRNALKRGWLHGIEIANGATYSPESFQIALDHGLTPVGVSDVHNLIDWDYVPHEGGHRPVNLVFAKERSSAAIREALMEGRTVVWYRNELIGRQEHMAPLLSASIELTRAAYRRADSHVLEITFSNRSDAEFELENLTDHTFVRNTRVARIPAHAERTLLLRTGSRLKKLGLEFRIRNALIAPGTHPSVVFETGVEDHSGS